MENNNHCTKCCFDGECECDDCMNGENECDCKKDNSPDFEQLKELKH